MNNLWMKQFPALLRREILEHPSLFIGAPVVLALMLFLGTAWILSLMGGDEIALGIEYLAVLFEGLSPVQMAPLFMLVAIPFIIVLYVCGIIYLLNTLYQDRKDGSVLFWQSMPVSNLNTVLSKVIALGVVVPVFYLGVLLILYTVAVLWLTILGVSYGIEIAGLGYMFMAALVSLVLVYLSALAGTLWLLPSIGWILLFSAFARRTPLLWAIGVLFLFGFLEDLIFDTQFLANWIESRSNPAQYLITDFGVILSRFFNYEMLFGVFVGAILLGGAVLMRRFTD
ncbi:MAG: hypothetical protein WD396_03660 [Pseudohongiellaceae bacterium]